MSASNRQIVVTLQAVTQGFSQQMQQATRQVQSFGQQVPVVSGNMNTFTATVSKNTGAFQASLQPIKQQGDALANVNTELKASAGQTQSLTGVLKDNVLAIGIAASGILGLFQQYTQLRKALILNERTQLAAAKATNRVEDIQRALNVMIAKGEQGTAKYVAKVADLKLAQEAAGIATERATIIQEQTNERVSEFAINILPNLISTTAGVTQVLQGFNISLTDIKGAFTGIKGIIINFITSLTGVGAAGITAGSGTTVASTAIQALDTTSKSAATSVKGLASSLGLIAIPLTAIELFREALDVDAKAAARLNVEAKSLFDRIREGDKTFGTSKEEIADYGKEVEDFRTGPLGSLLAMFYDATFGAIPGFNEKMGEIGAAATSAKKPIGDLNEAGGGIIKWITPTIDKTATYEQQINDIASGTGMYTDKLLAMTGNSIDAANATTKLDKEIMAATQQLAFAEGNMVKAASSSQFLAKAVDNSSKGFTKLSVAAKASGSEFDSGTVKFNKFIETTREGVQVEADYRASLEAVAIAHLDLDPRVELTTGELEEMTRAIIEGKGAAVLYADAIQKDLAPNIAAFNSLISSKNMKDFGKAFKELEFGDIGKKLGGALKDAFKPLQNLSEKSREITNLANAIITTGNNLSEKNVGKVIKEMADRFDELGKKNTLMKSFGKTVLGFLDSVPDKAEGMRTLNDTMNKFNELTEDGEFRIEDYNAVMQIFGEETGKVTPQVAKLTDAQKKQRTEAVTARANTDMLTGAFQLLGSQSSSTQQAIRKAMDKMIRDAQGWSKEVSSQIKTVGSSASAAAKNVNSLGSAVNRLKSKTITVTVKAKVGAGLKLSGGGGVSLRSQSNDMSGLAAGSGFSDASGGGGTQIINLHISGNELIEPRKITKFIKKVSGTNIPQMY